MNDNLKEVFPAEFAGAHLLKPLPKAPPPGVVGVIAQDTARFSMFGASMTSLVVPPGTRCEWQIGQGINDNCFAGETRFVTDDGIRTLADACGETVNILNRFGEWEEATVEAFGEQQLFRIEFDNGDEVLATASHRWWQEDGTRVATEDLREVPLVRMLEVPELDPEGVRHGIVYGDGYREGDYSKIVFVNEEKDAALVKWFPEEVLVAKNGVRRPTVKRIKRGMRVSMQPAHYKVLPDSYSPEYARGFIAGLIATDGSVGDTARIYCEGLARARAIAEIATVAGCVVNRVAVADRVSPYTGETRELSYVSMKPYSVPVILPSHIDRHLRKVRRVTGMRRRVISITPDVRRPTYCVVAPESESFTLANGMATSNCNNLTRTLMQRSEAEWLWLMGDDHIFAPETLVRLLAHDVDIVVPLCLMRAAPFQPVIFGEFMEDGVNRRYLDLSEHPEGGLVEVHSAGSAGMLIRKRVFDALAEPWFESRDRVMQAEDLYFCDKAREAGFKIYADLDTPLGHLTSTAVWPVRHPDGWAFGFRFPDGFELAMPAGVWITEEDDDERAA